MKRSALIAVACASVIFVGCSSDGDGGGDLDDTRQEAADRTVEEAAADGLELDQSCVEELVAGLSDADAEAIAAGSNAVSAEATAVGPDLVACASEDSLTDVLVEAFAIGAPAFDEDCARDALDDFDQAELATALTSTEPPADIAAAVGACLSSGG